MHRNATAVYMDFCQVLPEAPGYVLSGNALGPSALNILYVISVQNCRLNGFIHLSGPEFFGFWMYSYFLIRPDGSTNLLFT
jgi:hypothetical protein